IAQSTNSLAASGCGALLTAPTIKGVAGNPSAGAKNLTLEPLSLNRVWGGYSPITWIWSSPLASRSNNWTRESKACGFCLANSFQKPAPYSLRNVYHCTNCKPEAEILQLIEPF